jgi:prefoldin subunit 5
MFKDRKACEACNGNGILLGRLRLLPPVDVKKEGGMVTSDSKTRYYLERQVSSVRVETLEIWKRELEAKIVSLQAQISKYQVGIVEIDQELEARQAKRKG